MKNNKKEINELVSLYFKYNPKMNKGIGFKIKAYDTISNYINKYNMTYDDVKDCIEKNPMCQKPIWQQFYDYWFKNKNNNNKKSEYKNSIQDSTNIDDWI